ncbi:hypothetical protein PAPHI01_1835 [Pancytospora philotis]|nr:hypothetical protein PAPHI01_1835 [Pancytospora philotis]
MLSNIRLDILLITKGMRGNSSAITDRASGGVEARICKNAVWYFVRRAERNTPQNYEDYTVLRTMPISQLENASDSPAASQRRHSLYLWCMNIIRAWTMSEAEASFFGKDSNHRVNEPHFTLWWKNGQWCCTTAAAISAHRRPKK